MGRGQSLRARRSVSFLSPFSVSPPRGAWCGSGKLVPQMEPRASGKAVIALAPRPCEEEQGCVCHRACSLSPEPPCLLHPQPRRAEVLTSPSRVHLVAGPFRVLAHACLGLWGRLGRQARLQVLLFSPPCHFYAGSLTQLAPAGAPLLGSSDPPPRVWSTM